MLIGEKSNFAIEFFSIKDAPNQGYGKIWIDNEFIGTSHDQIYLGGYLLGTLKSIVQAKELNPDLNSLTKEELFDLLTSGSFSQSDSYLVRSSTYTDDFVIRCYKKGNETFVLWKLIGESKFEDLKNYRKDLILKSVRSVDLKAAVDDLETSLVKIGAIKKVK